MLKNVLVDAIVRKPRQAFVLLHGKDFGFIGL